MSTKRKNVTLRNGQRGMSIFVVAMSMVALLGMAALAMDLASLYLARNEAQRAADAAALAGAKAIVDSGYLSGAATQATAQNLAVDQATAIGEQNTVGGQTASVSFPNANPVDFSLGQNPRITVLVQRTQANGNAMPTFFGKIFGFMSADISATATAEAYTPSVTSTSSGTICLKPWLLPDCDTAHTSPGNANCPGSGYFVNPGTAAITNGLIGETLHLQPAPLPTSSPLPNQFYALQVAGGSTICPAAGDTSDPAFQMNTECCNTTQFFCGHAVNIDPNAGNIAAQTALGIENLINQSAQSASGNGVGGQDTLNVSSYPFQIMGGAGNPNSSLQNQNISSSNSIVTVPLYSGFNLNASGGAAEIVGFLQVFLTSVQTNGGMTTVNAVVLGASGCSVIGGGTGTGNSPPLLGATGSAYPVRLVKQQ